MNRQMLKTVAAAGLVCLCLAGGAWAYQSSYSSISVPGQLTDAGDWIATANLLSLTADKTWSGTLQVTSPQGMFKFAANKNWTTNWGWASPAVRLPARGIGPMWKKAGDALTLAGDGNTTLPAGDGNMTLPAGTAAGAYVFTFHEDTATYDVVPANPMAPDVKSARLVGSFNSEGRDPGGEFVGSGDIWTATDVAMSTGSTFRVLVNGTETWGRTGGSGSATKAQLAAGVTPCGEDAFVLAARDGKFTFTMDFRNNLLTAVQTETNGVDIASVRIYGNFVKGGTALPGPNLEESDGVWSGTFLVTNRTFLMGFAGLNAGGEIVKRWGGVSALSGSTNVTLKSYDDTDITKNRVNVTAGAGAYTLRFNPTSGSLALTRNGMQNLFHNPSFEDVWYSDDGKIVKGADWWGIDSGEATGEFDVHSGMWAVRLYKNDEEEPNLGNVVQDIDLAAAAGQTLQVSANFRAVNGWSGDMVRIIVEWMSGDEVVATAEKEVLNLGNAWQEATLETTVPQDNVKAHVLFKFDNAVRGESLLVDDVRAYLAGGRSEDFDTWGDHASFGPLDYGWKASRAKTVLNADLQPKVDGGLLISKYIEGSNNNKAIELYNGLATQVALTNYALYEYDNGAKSKPSRKMKLMGVLQPKECAIVTREDRGPNPPDEALQAGLTIRTNALRFNGDDVVVLVKTSAGEEFVDRVGQADTNASRTFWAQTMRDHTLVRKASVTNGTAGAVAKPFDLDQWDVLEKDDFGDVGRHSFSVDGPYWPAGRALCMDAGSTLTLGGIEAGGVGDVDFWFRTWDGEATLVAEMAADETSASWTEIWRTNVAATATNYVHAQFMAMGGKGMGAFRLRTAGGPALVDEINVWEAMNVRRIEHFSDWEACTPAGLYTRNQWTVLGQVNTNGEAGSMAAVLSTEGEYVQSPFFENGVGTVSFLLLTGGTDKLTTLALSTSTDGGSTWETNHLWSTGSPTRGTNLTWDLSYMTPSAVRISWLGGEPAVVDDVNVMVPSEGERTLTFDLLKPSGGGYNDYSVGGWTVTKTAVTNNGAAGNGGVMHGDKGSVILSPRLEELKTISFQFKYWPGKTTVRFKVEVSADGSKWTTVTTNAGADGSESAWTFYTTNVPAGTYHYVQITPTLKQQILIDEIGLPEPSAEPIVQLSAWLDPWPVAKEPFQVTASAYPKDGAVIQEVRAIYSIGGKESTNTLAAAGGGEYRSGMLTAESGQKVAYRVECVYTGAGIGTQTNRTAMEEVTVSGVRPGDVWINEVVYQATASESEDDPWDDWDAASKKKAAARAWWDTAQDHEFIELCGKAGTSIGGWKVVLEFVKAGDIAMNDGNAVYATYTVPSGTTLKNAGNGFGFYVIGDKQLKEAGEKVDLELTTLVPPESLSTDSRDHINDSAGVIRLKKGKLVIQSVSYGAYEGESEYIPAAQDSSTDCGISLGKEVEEGQGEEGGSPGAFTWVSTSPVTIGAANTWQILVAAGEKEPLPVWYDPEHEVVAREGTLAFAMFDPPEAANVDAVVVHYGYNTEDFANANYLTGTLYHRLKGDPVWTEVGRNKDSMWNNVTDDEGHGYVAFDAIPARTYGRLKKMEYFIEAGTTTTNYATVWLGTDSTGATIAYDSREAAEKSPFEHTFTIAQRIAVTNFVCDEEKGTLMLDTTGNDELDRFKNFKVEWAPTLSEGAEWQTLATIADEQVSPPPLLPEGEKGHTGAYQEDHFVVVAPQPTNRMWFIRVQPLPENP